MDVSGRAKPERGVMTNTASSREQQRDVTSSEDESSPVSGDLRRGPWTVEEDLLLVNYIAAHGEGRWNALARCARLKRTGKSCRLRWLNYLRPDLRRGNITAQEQLLILELHSRWGNRWSKIAQHLPGRTDNEIKNYWRTRVQKHARQLNCDVNSQQFKDLMRYLWMPRLLERINNSSSDDVLVAPAADDAAAAANNNEVELSLVSPPPPPPMDYCCWSSSCSDDNNSRSMMSAWCQPPHTSSSTPATVHGQLGGAAAETCWPEAPAGLSATSTASVYGDMTLPDLLDETMWAAADDLQWYTQIMGL